MITNDLTPNGDRDRYYPDSRKSVRRVVITWKKRPITRTALVLIWLCAAKFINIQGEGLSRKFALSGVKKQRLYHDLLYLMPWLPRYVRKVWGTDLTPEKVMQRFYMMFLNVEQGHAHNGLNKGKSRPVSASNEHPQNHKVLRKIHEQVETLFKLGRPIEQVEALLAGRTDED